MILSMLIGALYNVVDSLFVSRFSEDALSAVSLAFPVQNIIIAIGT
jgi:Na+-driven multidrug efflux pump